METTKNPAAVAATCEAQKVNQGQSNYSKVASVGLSGQARRVAFFVLENPGTLTHNIAQRCAVGNVSDACGRANSKLYRAGLRLVCSMPKPQVLNRFGCPSPVHEWHLVKLEGAK